MSVCLSVFALRLEFLSYRVGIHNLGPTLGHLKMVFWIFGWVHFFRVAPLEIWVVLARIIFSYRMKVLVFIRRFSNTAVSLKQLSAKSSLLCIPLLLILKCSYKKHSILVSRLGVLKKCSYFWLAAEALG